MSVGPDAKGANGQNRAPHIQQFFTRRGRPFFQRTVTSMMMLSAGSRLKCWKRTLGKGPEGLLLVGFTRMLGPCHPVYGLAVPKESLVKPTRAGQSGRRSGGPHS